jgi:aryl-alcohol dehydrogenase-like predicted oxidoreductase
MQYRRLGTSDLNVSAVCTDTWAIGGDFWGETDDQQSIRTIQAGIDAGVNFIDTAPAYGAGHSEEVVGRAIKGRRDKVVVATKCGVIRTATQFIHDLSPDSLSKEVDASLRRLGVDVIDLYQIHWPDNKTPFADVMEILNKAKDAGKVRHLGVSNFTVEQLEDVRQYGEIVSLQPHYSLLKRDIEGELVHYCLDKSMGIINYGTLGGGILTGKFKELPKLNEGDNRGNFYPWFKEPEWSRVQSVVETLREIAGERGIPTAHVAIAWTIQQPGITSALVGARTEEQARSNAKAADLVLTGEEVSRIEAAYRSAMGG